MNGQVLTKQYLIESIRDYNWALLFNRSKAKQLREKAQRILADFSQDNADLYSDDLSDYMDAYIKTFGIIRKRRASDAAMNSFHKLNRDSYGRYSLVKHQKIAGFLAFESKLFRNVASFFGRYDLTESEVRQLTSSRTSVRQSLGSSNNNNNNDADRDETPVHKVDVPNTLRVPHTDSLRPSEDPDYQAELRAYNAAGKNNKQNAKSSHSRKAPNPCLFRLRKVFFGIGITALTFLGYSKYVSIDNAEAREDRDLMNKAIEMGNKKQIEDTTTKTIKFDEPVFPSVISSNINNNTHASIVEATVKYKETSNPTKITTKKQTAVKEKHNIKTPVSIPTNQIKATSNDYQDSLAKAYKNYYDNTISLHVGEKGKTELYAQLNKAIHQGKITLPAGETMEHLALVKTISNLVQPNSQDNKLLQKITSGDELTAGQQQQLWQIVKKAGKKAGNIKGTGSYSKYDNSSEQVKQSHNKVLQQLNARLYKINNYGGK